MQGVDFASYLQLYPVYAARCANGHVLNLAVARIILREMEQYSRTEPWLPVDHYYTAILERLAELGKLKSYWVEPVLSYQSNKGMVVIAGNGEVDPLK